MPDARGHKVSCSNYQSEIELTLEILSGKWKALIIWNLHLHTLIRYNEFRRLIPSITQKMLTQQLKELEKYRIISRNVHPSVPPTVEYELTETGRELIPILEAMDQWGKKYLKTYSAMRENEEINAAPSPQKASGHN